MSDRISRFPVPELADLADDVRERILGVQEKAGFIPNVFMMLAHRPAEFRAFFDYHDALMEKQGAYWRLYEAQARRAEEDAQAAGVIIDSSLLHPAHPAGNP